MTDEKIADEEAEDVLPDDVGGGLRFVHLVELQTRAQVSELTATVDALIETLIGEGQLPLKAFEKRKRLTVIRETERASRDAGVEMAAVDDKYALPGLPRIDCEARLPLCLARCCTLPFVLSAQDLDEGVARWDYARPYLIRRRDSGYCVHNEGGCTIYEGRPAACRLYDCRKDRRIWVDFDARIPAP
jgi:Fe-S-cluster containining protein